MAMRMRTAVGIGMQRVAQEMRELVYLATGLDMTQPRSIGAILTERCNNRCLSCGSWRKDGDAEELTLEQWVTAFADLRRFVGDFVVQFSGGEPFVFKPFLDLVEWCSASGIRWVVTTNGSALSAKNAGRLARARPLAVNISVDGATDAVHDRSRGVAGSLQAITRGIATLRETRQQSGASFPIRIKATVHRENMREMADLVRWTERVGANSIDFSPVRPWTPEVESSLWLRASDEQCLADVVDTLVAMKRAGAPIETEEARIRSWPAHFRAHRITPSLGPCRVGLRDYCILPNGDVRSCWFYPVLGNVKSSSAKAVWLGAVAQALRAEMTRCPSFGDAKCALSCLSHRTLREDARRVILLTRRSVAQEVRQAASC
jgi:MoaA/NifB/PqqE/SkfB family radical SAM enzyme